MFKIILILFKFIITAFSQCNVFDTISIPSTPSRVIKSSLKQLADFGIGIYTKFDPSIMKFSTELSEVEKMHVFTFANPSKQKLGILYSIKLDQKIRVLYHEVILIGEDNYNTFSLPIDLNIATQQWIFMYIGYAKSSKQLSVYLQLKNDYDFTQNTLKYDQNIIFDSSFEFTIGGLMEIRQPIDVRILYQLTQFRGSISDFYFKADGDCYFGTIPLFNNFIQSLICTIPDPCPEIWIIDLQKGITQMKGYNFIIKTSQYKESRYQISGWVKLETLNQVEIYQPVLIRASLNQNYQDNSQVGDRLFYLRYKQSVQPEENGFYFSTYQVNEDLTVQAYKSTPEDEWIDYDSYYEYALTEWHYFVFQHGMSDPDKNTMLYFYFSKDNVEKRKYFKRKHLETQQVYFFIGGDKFTQTELLLGVISDIQLKYCFKSDLEISKPCHYSCQSCKGPSAENCDNCSSDINSNREFIPSTGQCGCKKEFLEKENTVACDDSKLLFNFVSITEIEEQQKCEYGEFIFEKTICIKCPSSLLSDDLYCGDCLTNPRTWQYNSICTYDFIQISKTDKSNYIKKIRSTIDYTYYIIDKDFKKLIYCEGCSKTKNTNSLTQYITIQNINYECKTCYVSRQQKCVRIQNYNCLYCTNELCIFCRSGSTLINGSCYPCPKNCLECSTQNNAPYCTECEQHFGLVQGQCYQCGSYCKQCLHYVNYFYQLDYLKCFKCIDDSKYFIAADGFNCLENTLQNCEYALDYFFSVKYFTGIDLSYEPISNRDSAITYCAKCAKGYTLNFDTKSCDSGSDYQQVIVLANIAHNFGKHNSDASKNQVCDQNNCIMCLNKYLEGKDYCISCKYGYHVVLSTGKCSKCPVEKHCRSCSHQNKYYKDSWKWEIRPFYKTVINRLKGHLYLIEAAQLDPRLYEVVCTSCQQGFTLYQGQCIEDCKSDCSKCEVIDGQSQCIACKSTIQGQLQSLQNNTCIQCPYNCALCYEQSQEEYQQVNNKYQPNDSTKLFLRNQCLKSFPLTDVYYNWNINQFTECSTIKKLCYKQATIPLNIFCNDLAYQTALTTSIDQTEFKKQNLQLSEVFSLNTTPHLQYLESQQFYQIMNENQIKTLELKLNLIYPSTGDCEFVQEGFFNTTFQQNIFTLQNLELEIIGDLNKNVLIKSFIDINNFTKVTLTKMKFVSNQNYNFLIANYPNPIKLQLNNVKFTGVNTNSQYSLQLKIQNPLSINLQNVEFNNFKLLNTDGLISYTFTKLQQESFEMIFESVTFKEFYSLNSMLVYFNFGIYQRNQKISLNNINFEKVELSTSKIFYSNQVIDQALTGSISISNFKLQSSKIDEVKFLSLYPFKVVNMYTIEVLNSNLIQSYFIITNNLESKNLVFYNNNLNKSVLIQNDIYDTSETKFQISQISLNKNVYDYQQTFVNITLKLGSTSIDSYYSQENIFSGSTSETNATVILSLFANVYLQAKTIFLYNITSIRATGYPEFSLSNADQINLTNINFDLSSSYHFQSIQQQLSCIQDSFSEVTRTTLMFLLKFKEIYCDQLKIINQIAVNVPLIYIESETKVNIIQQETIQFINSEFEMNKLIITSPSKQQSIIAIISEQQQNIIFKNITFNYNHQHSYEQSRYQSSSSIVIESPLSSINLDNIRFNQNLISNSQSSNMYIRALNITITNCLFLNQNIYHYTNLKSSLNWGMDSSQAFYFENLFTILPINSQGGSGYFYGQNIQLESSNITQSYAESGGAFYIQGTSQTKIILQNLIFSNCSASLQQGIISQGGAIIVDSTQSNLNLLINNCNFTNISSKGEGGSIYIKPSLTQNQIKFNNLTISNSFSLRSGFLEIKYEETISSNYYVTLSNMIINNQQQEFNYYLGKLVKLSNTELQMASTSYLIVIQNGNINITNFQVKQNQLSGIFYFDQQQFILISKLQVTDCLLYQQPLVKISLNKISSSELMIFDTEFRNITEIKLTEVSNQSITYLQSAQFSCLKNTTSPNSLEKYYENLTSILIDKIQVQLASQITYKYSILWINQVYSYHNLQFNTLLFANNNCTQCIGGLFNVSQIEKTAQNTLIQIEKLNLINNECGKSGCLVLQSPSSYQYDSNNKRLLQEYYQFKDFFSVIMKNSQFLSNKANYGAGFVAIQIRIIVYNSVFNNNQARYGGGAIYYVRVQDEKLSLFNTQIIDNTAQFGGAVYQTNFAFNTLDSMNLMVYSNQADQFGQNFVSPPVKLTIQIYQNQTYLNTKTIANDTNSIVEEIIIQSFTRDFDVYNFIQLPSGQPISTYKFYSEYQKKYILTNQTLRIIPLNSQDQQMKDLKNSYCSISGRLVSSATNDSNNSFSQNFTNYKQVTYNMTSQDYNLDNLIIYFNPNWNSQLALQLKFQCDSIKIPVFDENPPYQLDHYLNNYSLLLNVQAYQCQVGEYLRQEEGTCVICDSSQDQYTVLAGQQCKVKDSSKMINVTSTRIQIRPEYWRPSEKNEIIEYCKNMPINCEGGWEPGNPSCFEGHIGALCEQCDLYNIQGKGSYSTSTIYKCGSCESVGDNSSKIILITFWTLVSIAISVNGTVETNEQKALVEKFKKLGLSVNPRTGQSGILIKVLTNYMQIAGAISTFQLQLPSALSSFFSSVGSPLEAMSYSLIWGLIMPLFYILLFFIFYGLAILIKKANKNIAVITTTFIFMYLYLQPTLISGFVSLASYRDISNVLWVQGNVAYKYNESQHQKWLVTFILPALLIIVLMIPLFMFYSLYKIKDKLQVFSNRQSWGYLYNEYSNSSYFWEIIKIMQKGLIIIFLTFYEDLIVIKAALIFIIVQIYLMLTKNHRPYQTKNLNLYDEQSSIICGVSIVLGIAIYSAIVSNNQEIVWPFYILLIVVNIYYLLKLFYALAESQLSIQEQILDKVRDIINKKFPNLRESSLLMRKLLTNQSEQRKRVQKRFKRIKEYLFKIARDILAIKNREVSIIKCIDQKGSENNESEIKIINSYQQKNDLKQGSLAIRHNNYRTINQTQNESNKAIPYSSRLNKSDDFIELKDTNQYPISLTQNQNIKVDSKIDSQLIHKKQQTIHLIKDIENESIHSENDQIQ